MSNKAPKEIKIDFSGKIVVPSDHDTNKTMKDIVVTRSPITAASEDLYVPANTGNEGFVPRNTGDARRAAARAAEAASQE